MSVIRIQGTDIAFEECGQGSCSVVFAHGLLMDRRMFAAQIEALKPHYRVIAYDHPGQGASPPSDRGYSIDRLSELAAEFMHRLDAREAHFVGLSMGGFVGLRLAARCPGLLRSLSLLDTSAAGEAPLARLRYRAMQAAVGMFGPRVVLRQLLPIIFGTSFLNDPARAGERETWIAHLAQLPRRITGPVGGVLARADVSAELPAIRCPSLILVGEEDRATPVAKSQAMHVAIAGSRLQILPSCGHSCSIEAPEAVSTALLAFLREVDAQPAAA